MVKILKRLLNIEISVFLFSFFKEKKSSIDISFVWGGGEWSVNLASLPKVSITCIHSILVALFRTLEDADLSQNYTFF